MVVVVFTLMQNQIMISRASKTHSDGDGGNTNSLQRYAPVEEVDSSVIES